MDTLSPQEEAAANDPTPGNAGRTRLVDLPATFRPREKLRLFGPESLSDAELLAVVLGNGNRFQSVLEVGNELLRGRMLSCLARLGPAQLEKFGGVGVAGASRIAAAMEIGLRLARAKTRWKQVLARPDDVFLLMRDRLLHEKRERVVVLGLDSRRRLIGERCVSIGTLGYAVLHPAEVFRTALNLAAAVIILVHNHPSGDPRPSGEDRDITARLSEAGQIVGVPLLDHIIVGAEGYTSFREEGWLC